MHKPETWCVMLVLSAAVLAVSPGSAAPPPAHFEDTADHVHVTAVSPADRDETKFVIILSIDPGFHINANPASEDDLIPTTLHVTNRTPLRVTYPAPIHFKPKFSDQAIDVYEGVVRIIAEFARNAGSPRPLAGTITAQACTEAICLPPADLPLPDQSMTPPPK